MKILGRAAGFSRHGLGKQSLVCLLSLSLLFASGPLSLSAQDAPAQDTQAPPPNGQAPPYAQQTPEQLQRLVAPIALYPDSLVAQILAASTFPEQVVEADRWVQAHPDLKGDGFGQCGGPTALGPERESAGCVSICAGKYGQEPFVDVFSGRCLLQPATGCDGCGAGDAPESARRRQS